jgi:hypothetical protein
MRSPSSALLLHKIHLCRRANHLYAFAPSLPRKRGARAIATDVGQGCDGRVGVARRAMRTRTAKSRGPGLPTLRSSLRGNLAGDVGYQARHSGESAKQPLTPLRRECRGVATDLCCLRACYLSIFAREALGCGQAPGIPCALSLFGGRRHVQPGQIVPRGCALPSSPLLKQIHCRPGENQDL